MEHLKAIVNKEAFATALAVFITSISTSDIPSAIVDYLASATLVALLKKNEEETQALRELMVPDFILPIRPLVMSCIFVILACKATNSY